MLIIFIFRVECFECDGNYNDCNPCNDNVKFDQSPDEISEDGRGSNQLKVSNLDSEAFYKFKVNIFSLVMRGRNLRILILSLSLEVYYNSYTKGHNSILI